MFAAIENRQRRSVHAVRPVSVGSCSQTSLRTVEFRSLSRGHQLSSECNVIAPLVVADDSATVAPGVGCWGPASGGLNMIVIPRDDRQIIPTRRQ